MDRGEWKYLGGIWLAALAVYLPIVFRGHSLADNPALLDQTFNFMPNVAWMAASWKAGLLPLWNPHHHFGMPQLGYTHCGGLYPVTVGLFTLLPYVWAVSGLIIFHALAVGALCYLVLRGHEVEPLAAMAGAIAFIFSGAYFGSMFVLWSMGSTAGFLLAWLCLRRLAAGPRFSRLAGAALGLAWTGIAGDIDLFIYGMPLLGLVTLAAGRHSRAGLARSALLFGLATAAGSLLMFAMALPSAELVHQSIRGPAMPFKITILSLGGIWPLVLPTMAFPFRYYRHIFATSAFNHGLSPAYQHFLALWLFGLGFYLAFARRSERALAGLAVGLFAFFVLRELPLTAWIFDPLPLIGNLHSTGPVILFFHLLGIIIGGRALTAARREPAVGRAVSSMLILAGAALAAAQPFCVGGPERYLIGAAAMAAGFFTLRSSRPGWRAADGAAARMAAGLIVIEVLTLAWRQAPRTDPKQYDLPPALAPTAASLTPESRYAIFEQLLSEDPNAPSPIFGLFELASGANNITGPARVQPARAFLFTSLYLPEIIYHAPNGDRVLDLWSMTNPASIDRGRMHLFNLAGPSLILSRGLPVPYSTPYSLLLPGAAKWRSVNVESTTNSAIARAPASLAAQLATLPGDRLQLSARADHRAWLVAVAGPPGHPRLLLARRADANRPLDLSASANPLGSGGDFRLGLLPNLVGPASITINTLQISGPSRSLRRRETRGDVSVFDNRDALPRAFVVHRAESVPSIPRLLERLSDPARFHPLDSALLETEPQPGALAPAPAGKNSEKVIFNNYGPQVVEMTANLSAPGLLILTDCWFPGWRARVQTGGGEEWEARVLPADLAFRALYLPRGRHFVSFTYEPASFRVGLFASIATLLALLAASAFRLSRGRPRLRPSSVAVTMKT